MQNILYFEIYFNKKVVLIMLIQEGKILVIEGTDFSGKTTQYEKTVEELKKKGYLFGSDSFPNYDSWSSSFVTAYLRGEFGNDAMSVKPKVASCFYAMDRYASFMQRGWGKTYRDGGNILFARYLSSNILHQASKYDSWEEVKEFIDWLYDFECNLLGIPKDDCVILLNMPPEKAQELKQKRLKEQNGLSSNGSEKDIHEDNADYLRRSYEIALKVADYLNWKVVDCVNSEGQLKTIEEINKEIMMIVESVFTK